MEDILDVKKESSNKSVVKKEEIQILVCSLLLGLVFNLLFYNKPLGISYLIFVTVFYGLFLWTLRYKIIYKFSFRWALIIPIIALSLTYFIFSNQIFAVLNFLIIPILIIAQTILITYENKHKWFEATFVKDVFYGMFNRPLSNISRLFIVGLSFINIRKSNGKHDVIKKVIMGLAISLPLLILIISLLASADRFFKHFMDEILNSLGSININDFSLQTFIVLLITMIAFSYTWSFSGSNGLQTHKQPSTIDTNNRCLDPIISITILSVINCVYLIFTCIQFAYMFGAINNALPLDFTYADYARRGFFELLMVTLINFTLLLSGLRLTRKDGKLVSRSVQLLNSLLVICTMVILASAFLRMSLYETAYGYTYLRVLTHSFMMFLGVLFVIAFYKIWNERISLLKPYIVVSLIAYVIINFANIDVLITKNNIDRYYETGKLDTQYLRNLSYDAIPELVNLLDDEKMSTDIQKYLVEEKEILSKKQPWQALNLSRDKAKQVLSQFYL